MVAPRIKGPESLAYGQNKNGDIAMRSLRMNEVFVPGGMPRHTYVPRIERALEQRLYAISDNLCKLAVLTGPTKSGKTVLARKVFHPSTTVWIDAGFISTEDDFWKSVSEQLNIHTYAERTETSESAQQAQGSLEGTIGVPLITTGKGAASATTGHKLTIATRSSATLSPKLASTEQLKQRRVALVIDDFHYLDKEIQGNIVRAMKPLIFEGVPVLLIAVPHRRFDSVKVEREMVGRFESIEVPLWDHDELTRIAKTGFPLLNLTLPEAVYSDLAFEAFGSPHLMQEFCRYVCKLEGLDATLGTPTIIHTVTPKGLFSHIATHMAREIFHRLATSPSRSAHRSLWRLIAGGEADIHEVVLATLTRMAPGRERVAYEHIRHLASEVVAGPQPRKEQIVRALQRMSEVSLSTDASIPVVEWDGQEQSLYITDPFFAFYLRWGNPSQ
jgi:hypothetical protein